MTKLQTVILCGGSGTRLWPLSREAYPKQFIALNEQKTMLQETVLRVKGLTKDISQNSAPILVCNAAHRFLAAHQMLELGGGGSQIILEPVGRNTAPALTVAALQAMEAGDDPVLLAMPADHLIADLSAFHFSVEKAFALAAGGAMATFGIVADRPETGYGYIQHGDASGHGAFFISSFAEKPDVERAKSYLEAGNYFWNSGLFMVRASVWLNAMQACRNDILESCKKSFFNSIRDKTFIQLDEDVFSACPSDSIDYAVMERLPNMPELGIAAYVVPLQAGWSDLGAWDALWEAQSHDSEGNAKTGDVIMHGCSESMLFSTSRMVAGVGLNNIVVVETPDAVLVVEKSHTQDVKQIVSQLKASGKTLAHNHRKNHRPWGWYDSIDQGERFQVKRIVVNPGAKLSLQKHFHRAEHWVVVSGTAEVTNGDQTFLLCENQSTFIPQGHVHRLSNPGKVPLEMIEVQSGAYLGEDDIVRYEDTYGRAVK